MARRPLPPSNRTVIVKAERSHYFDVGVNQIIVPGLTIGLDSYYKLATNLIDEGQFGAPIILTAFNYAKAYVAGGSIHRKLRPGAVVDLWQCRLFARHGYRHQLRAVQFCAG